MPPAAPRRVAVFRALQLGDLLCAVPALRAMRRAWPTAEIVLIGLPWARQFAARFGGYVDRFYEFPGYPGLPEREPCLPAIPEFLAAMQAEGFDLAIQLHGSGRFVNELVTLFSARRTAGFFLPGDHIPCDGLFTPWPRHGLEIHRLLALTEFLGLATDGDHLEFPLSECDFARLEDVTFDASLERRQYAIVHPGASHLARQWPIERFAAVGDALAEAGLTIVLTGVRSEQPLTRELAASMHAPVLDLAGRTDLGMLGALVAQAAIVVANDTGISHIAAALRTPSVIISTGDNPARWSPIDRGLHRVQCRRQGVGVQEVLDAARSLLPTRRRGADRLVHREWISV